jgi:hypothetical protein
MPPIVEQNYLLQELRDPEKLKHRRHDGIPGPGGEHHGGSDGTNGGYTIGGVVYYGGRWNGPLTAAQIAAITAAGHGARIYKTSDYREQVLALSPTAYYRLNDISGTTAVDASGNAHHGSYEGGFQLGVAGLIAGDDDPAVRFDGTTGRVAVPVAAIQIPSANAPKSIVTWYRTKDIAAGGGYILRAMDSVDPLLHLALGVGNTAGQPFLQIRGPDNVLHTILLNMNTVDDHVHMMAWTRGSDQVNRLYMGGIQSGSFTDTLAGAFAPDRPRIGGQFDTVSAVQFDGVIDEFAIFNAELSPAEILDLYEAGRTGLLLPASID